MRAPAAIGPPTPEKLPICPSRNGAPGSRHAAPSGDTAIGEDAAATLVAVAGRGTATAPAATAPLLLPTAATGPPAAEEASRPAVAAGTPMGPAAETDRAPVRAARPGWLRNAA